MNDVMSQSNNAMNQSTIWQQKKTLLLIEFNLLKINGCNLWPLSYWVFSGPVPEYRWTSLIERVSWDVITPSRRQCCLSCVEATRSTGSCLPGTSTCTIAERQPLIIESYWDLEVAFSHRLSAWRDAEVDVTAAAAGTRPGIEAVTVADIRNCRHEFSDKTILPPAIEEMNSFQDPLR